MSLQSTPFLLPGLATLLGLLVGSFLNVVVYRLPVMMDRARATWLRMAANANSSPDPDPKTPGGLPPPAEEPFNLLQPRSACPACQTPIKARHNVPVLSWLWLRGRCAACAARISPRYPLVEAGTGLVSGFLIWHFGDVSAVSLAALGITWVLIALALIDLDQLLLPDAITLPLLWSGLLFHLTTGQGEGSPFATLEAGVIGAIGGYLTLWLVYWGYKLATKKEGMGHGDFKLFAALLAWLGYPFIFLILLLSALTGALVGIALIALGRHARLAPLPFGPFLAAAGWVAMVWGPQLMVAWPFLDPFHRFSSLGA